MFSEPIFPNYLALVQSWYMYKIEHTTFALKSLIHTRIILRYLTIHSLGTEKLKQPIHGYDKYVAHIYVLDMVKYITRRIWVV